MIRRDRDADALNAALASLGYRHADRVQLTTNQLREVVGFTIGSRLAERASRGNLPWLRPHGHETFLHGADPAGRVYADLADRQAARRATANG